MQTSAPFVLLGIFFWLFGFLLQGFLGSVLAIFSAKHRFGYATSIRFTLQGGFLEMILAFNNSRRHVPWKTSLALILTFLASLIAIFSSVPLGRQVYRTQVGIDQSSFVSNTYKVLTTNGDSEDWTTFVRSGQWDESTTVETVFNGLLTASQYINDFDTQTIYKPRTYTGDFYNNFACQAFGAGISKNYTPIASNPVANLCGVVSFDLQIGQFQWNVTNTTVMSTPLADTPTVVMTTIYGHFWDTDIVEFSPVIYLATMTTVCSFMSEATQNSYTEFPKSGMTSPPSTSMFRCKYPTGEMSILAPTYFIFAVHPIGQFSNITGTIFDSGDKKLSMPLLSTMQTVINNGTFSVNTFNSTLNSTMVALTDATVASPLIHYLSCNSRWVASTNDLGLSCVYVVVEAAVTTAQPSDPMMTAATGPRPTTASTSITEDTNHLVIKHLASGSVENTGLAVFNISNILAVTQNVTKYAAQLGPNFFVNLDQQQVYILYETIKLQNVSVLADWIFWFMVAVMILSAIVWGTTEWRLGYRYTGSLLKIVHADVQSVLTKITTTAEEATSTVGETTATSESTTTTTSTMTVVEEKEGKLKRSAILMNVVYGPLMLDNVPVLQVVQLDEARANREVREEVGQVSEESTV